MKKKIQMIEHKMRKINLNPILAKKTDLSERFAEESGVAEEYGDLPM